MKKAFVTLWIAFLFFTIFTPVAVVLRMVGWDLLVLHRKPQASTYWVACRAPSNRRAA